jgi:hypothetical protein
VGPYDANSMKVRGGGSKGIPLLTNLTSEGMVNTMPLATFFPRKKPDTHDTGGLVDHRVNMDGCQNLAP